MERKTNVIIKAIILPAKVTFVFFPHETHQGFSVLVDEVLRRFGPSRQDHVFHTFFGDLQTTKIKTWNTTPKNKSRVILIMLFKNMFLLQ